MSAICGFCISVVYLSMNQRLEMKLACTLFFSRRSAHLGNSNKFSSLQAASSYKYKTVVTSRVRVCA
jgi:hypothetical protein